MKCEDPKLCYIKDDVRIFVPFSKASPILRQVHNYVFNCDQCLICRKRRAKELAIRCVLHASMSDKNCFLTLTYDETREGYHNDFEYKDIQDFKKKLRRHCETHFGTKIQIFNVHEYGKRGKKHWHLVLFNHDFSEEFIRKGKKVEARQLFTVKSGNRLYTSSELTRLWLSLIHI